MVGNAFQLLTCLVTVLGQAQIERPHPQALGLSRSGLGLLPCWGPLLEQWVSLLWRCLRGQPQAPVFAHRSISPPANLGTCGKLGLPSLASGSHAARGDRQRKPQLIFKVLRGGREGSWEKLILKGYLSD